MSTVITVRNKLEVRPGGVLQVPGCEPTSSLTGMALSRNISCAASIIPVEDALELIPGSRLVRTLLPRGQNSTGIYFELPDGPPPNGNYCPKNCIQDWYKILRDNAKVKEPDAAEDPLCSSEGSNFTGCVTTEDPLRRAPNPNLIPNDPLRAALTPQPGPLEPVDPQGRLSSEFY